MSSDAEGSAVTSPLRTRRRYGRGQLSGSATATTALVQQSDSARTLEDSSRGIANSASLEPDVTPVQVQRREAPALTPLPTTLSAGPQRETADTTNIIPGKLVCLVDDRQNLIRMNFWSMGSLL